MFGWRNQEVVECRASVLLVSLIAVAVQQPRQSLLCCDLPGNVHCGKYTLHIHGDGIAVANIFINSLETICISMRIVINLK